MIGANLLKRIFGSRNQRMLKQYDKIVSKINHLESSYQKLTDSQLRAKTDEFKERLKGKDRLNDVLVEAFAAVREASVRTLGLRHYDVQMIGGMALHEGKIAEMQTGEGKTLVATLPAYLNALTGSVHIVTVNDYLAKRDAFWMQPIYEFLGMTVGTILTSMAPDERKDQYAADIIYGTNNEFGFDYLRDNMAFEAGDRVQRELQFAIVDEVDSILIDEARTPLIISGPTEDTSDVYVQINKLMPQLTKREHEGEPGDFFLEEKDKIAAFTEEGHEKIEALLLKEGLIGEDESLYDAKNVMFMHHLNAALRAHYLFHRDVDYIVKNNEVIIVDEHTGRTLSGRRWSDGLHQAVEAKENVKIQLENQTLASITFQNYFRLYDKLAGMTGTADTEAYEFQQIYGLEVVVIPSNKPCLRADHPDYVYLGVKDKFEAIIEDVKECRERAQPVLIGTASIETSEILSKLLTKAGIKHNVLNAKFHEKEAAIITEAGMPGAITIATNMAGRGTDIVLGGNLQAEIAALGENASAEDRQRLKLDWQKRHEQVIAAGGLHMIGSERHEARRIDNQLRGRSGRQGDPGSSRFYLSLEDDLIRIFASEGMSRMMEKFGMRRGEPLESSWLSSSIEGAQRKVEAHNFEIRKQLLEYDDVANDQRKVIYEQRFDLLKADDASDIVDNIMVDVIESLFDSKIQEESFEEEWDVAGLERDLKTDFDLDLQIADWIEKQESIDPEQIKTYVRDKLLDKYHNKRHEVELDIMKQVEKSIMLQLLDRHWRDHLAAMDYLRQGIHLRGYAQKNPKQEYKRESFMLFSDMLDSLKYEAASTLVQIHIRSPDEIEELEKQRKHALSGPRDFQHQTVDEMIAEQARPMTAEEQALLTETEHLQRQQNLTGVSEVPEMAPIKRDGPKVGRNEPCPCGSDKKYKQCCGKLS